MSAAPAKKRLTTRAGAGAAGRRRGAHATAMVEDAIHPGQPAAAVRVEHPAPGVTLLRLNRPERRNALDDAAVDVLVAALDAASGDHGCRVVVVTGEGPGFCAGFDLSVAMGAPEVPADAGGETTAWSLRQEKFAAVVTRMRAVRQPIIAAVNGAASGAGFCIALGADVRIAARAACFNAAFVKIGLTGCDMGLSWLLPRCVGLTRAAEIMLTGRFVDAAEAERIGIVSEVLDGDRLLPRALEIAAAIAANSPVGVWMTKRGLWANVETGSLQAAIELENRSQMLVRTTGEMAAAVRQRSVAAADGRRETPRASVIRPGSRRGS